MLFPLNVGLPSVLGIGGSFVDLSLLSVIFSIILVTPEVIEDITFWFVTRSSIARYYSSILIGFGVVG